MTDYATAYEAMSLNPYDDLRSTGLLALNKLQVRLQMADEILKQVATEARLPPGTARSKKAVIPAAAFNAAVDYLRTYNV